MDAIAVRVIADDKRARDEVLVHLGRQPQVRLVSREAEVVLVITDEVSLVTLRSIRAVMSNERMPDPALVIMCNRIERREMLYAMGLGLVTVLSREADEFSRLAEIVTYAARRPVRTAALPSVHLGDTAKNMDESGQPAALSTREVAVLRLLADGLDTTGIASQLSYSERTVKHIIHGVVSRERLRNRVHAVAFALRLGVL